MSYQKEAQYLRCKNIIRTIATGEDRRYPSINAAKRESSQIQGKALGSGIVRVVDKLPPIEQQQQ